MALIEAYGSHLRNLITFLYPGPPDAAPPKRGDVLAEDFIVPAKEWQAQRPRLTDRLRKARIRANKEIAHLTADRISGTPTRKEWDPALAGELGIALRAFAALATSDHLHPDVPAKILQYTAERRSAILVAETNLTTEIQSTTLPSATSAARPYGF